MLTKDEYCRDPIFAESLVIRNIDKLKSDLEAEFQKSNSVVLDFAPDVPADFAGVQLILATRGYALSLGKEFRLARPAQGQLADVIERGGFLQNRPAEDLEFWRPTGEAQ